MSKEPFVRRARIRAKSPEEFKQWRRLAERARKNLTTPSNNTPESGTSRSEASEKPT